MGKATARRTLYDGGSLPVAMNTEMRRNLERESEREEISAGDLVRFCIVKALPMLKESTRKRRRISGGNEGDP